MWKGYLLQIWSHFQVDIWLLYYSCLGCSKHLAIIIRHYVSSSCRSANMWPDFQNRLPHISILPTMGTPDWETLLTWSLVSRKYQHNLINGCSFINNEVMIFQGHKIVCVCKSPFHKSSHSRMWYESVFCVRYAGFHLGYD